MNTEITVSIVSDNAEGFIAKAVGFPGVITYGKTQEEAVSFIPEAWNAMVQFNAIQQIGSNRQRRRGSLMGEERRIQLQLD